MVMDYRKKIATSCKHNTNFILPGPMTPAQEQEIECRRVEWIKVFNDFMNEFTDEKGVQESNLTPQEARGLKKWQDQHVIPDEGLSYTQRMEKKVDQ